MKVLAVILTLAPSVTWADCTHVGTVLVDCDGQRGYELGNQTWTYAPQGGLEPYHATEATMPSYRYEAPQLLQAPRPKGLYDDPDDN